MRLAEISKNDCVYDLGCGDGRLLISSAKLGARGVGYEINKKICLEARENVKNAKLEHMIQIHDTDALNSDLKDATVVLLYLSETGNAKLLPNLQKYLNDGAKIVTSLFPFPEHIKANKIEYTTEGRIPIHLYIKNNGIIGK